MQLGSSGLMISRHSLGAMTFGSHTFNGFTANVDQPEADRIVAHALDHGVNLIDTASGYGDGTSEEMVGAAVRATGRRDRTVIATKISPWGEDPNEQRLSRQSIIASAEASVRRLGTDWIDLYQLHGPDFDTPWEEVASALELLVHRGDVRYVGWPNHPAWHAALGRSVQESHGFQPFTAAQIHYSLIGRDAEFDLLRYCRAAGLGTLIWSPLASGFLTGRYSRDANTTGRRATFDFPPIDPNRDYDVVDRLRVLAEGLGMTPAQLAYAWLLHQPGVTSVIVGASRFDQWQENVATADTPVPVEILDELSTLTLPSPIYPYTVSG